MPKTKAERLAATEHALGNQQLEGLKPDKFGMSLIEEYINGDLTPQEAIHALDQHYKGSPNAKVKVA